MASINKPKIPDHWYDSPIKRVFAIISGFAFVASLGYGFGVIQKNIEFRMERFEMQQDFNKKLQEQTLNCEEEKQKLVNDRVERLESVVHELQTKFNEK
jgi:hypothetical protein